MSLWSHQCKILLGVCLLVSAHGIKADNRGFLLTAPNTLYVNTTETVCVSFHNVNGNVRITVRLTTEKANASKSIYVRNGKNTCLELKIPMTSSYTGRLEVQVIFYFPPYTIHQYEARVAIKRDSVMTFIETDKKVYKHGQRVLFRIFRLTIKLLPVSEPVPEVWIENPLGVRLAQWKTPHAVKGLTDLSFELSDEPSLGEWSICVKSMSGNIKKQTFLVKEYILPKFEVTITTTPSVLLFDFESFLLKVCAQYTFERIVHGRLSVEAKVETMFGFSYVMTLSNESFDLVRGCHEMKIFKNNFTVDDSTYVSQFWEDNFGDDGSPPAHDYWTSINYFAEVIENGTDVKVNSSKSQEIFRQRLQFEFQSKKYFKPNMTYSGKILVQQRNGNPAVNETMTLKVKSNGRTHLIKQLISNHLGEVDFVFLPTKRRAYEISLQESLDSRKNIMYEILKSWYSPSQSYLQIEPLSDRKLGCTEGNVDLLVNFRIAKKNVIWKSTFYYQIMARGRLVIQREAIFQYNVMKHKWLLSNGQIIGNITLPISNVFSQMSPVAYVLVYLVTKDGEIISDSEEIQIEKCFENNVTLSFDEDEILPSTNSVIEVNAYPKSLCALNIVDKSAHLLSSMKFLGIEKVYATISETYPKRVTPPSVNRNCSHHHHGESSNSYIETDSTFKDVGLVTISNLNFTSLPCPKETRWEEIFDDLNEDRVANARPATAMFNSSSSKNKPSHVIKSAVEIRDYFPENWLWELHDLENGSVRLHRKIPHSITTWIGTAFCLSRNKGLGVSQPASVRGFQAFFLSFTMPYSVKNEEVAPIIVTMFNYLSKCIPVRIFIEGSDKYTLVSSSSSADVCLCGLPHTHKFWIRPSFIGNINVTVHASSVDKKSSDICKAESQVANDIAGDAATNQLLVKAQGFPREVSNASWICQQEHPDETFSQVFDLELPSDVIQGSERAFVKIIGDLMGPTIQGLESLVKLPVGCGEQNMVLFAPNVYILQYLTNSQQLTDDIMEKALNHLRTGYQHQLNYKHQDGSYSAFGERDYSGSIWLTAFVLKSFAQAEPFVYIDLQELQNSEAFIFKNQLPDGSFKETGRVLSKAMQGGIGSKTSDQSLATYILIALLEAGSAPNSANIKRTFDYLSSQDYKQDNTYLLAMKAYAAALAKRNEFANLYLQQLNQRASRTGDLLYWNNGDNQESNAIDIEITSYVLLAIATQNSANSISNALPIVQWLTKQRNAYGGFTSTQDTILALQALAKYASLTQSGDVSIDVKLTSADNKELFEVNNGNKLLQQVMKISSLPTRILIEITGTGCVMVQLAMTCNVLNAGSTNAFHLDVTVKPSHLSCPARQLEICASYELVDSYSNMAVIEVQMISGFEPDAHSLDVLQNSVDVQLKRWDISAEGSANLYFEELSRAEKCFSFSVIEKFKVHYTKPAIVKVYDYYEPELTVSETYSFSEGGFCGNK